MAIDPGLEHDYVFSARYPERGMVYGAIAAASEAARREWPVHMDLAYGPHPRERLDLFAGVAGSPLLVFVHGGYWSSLAKSSFSYVAPPFLRRGFSVAVMGYPLAPAMPVASIARSVRAGVRWLANEGTALLPEAGPCYLCGHSAGGNLAALAAIPGAVEEADTGSRAPPIAGCAALSGIFDVRPLLRTSIAARAALDESSVAAISPRLLPAPAGWLLAATGSAETPGFLAQSSGYVDHCRSLGCDATAMMVPGANHYTVLLDLGRDDGCLVEAIHSRLKEGRG